MCIRSSISAIRWMVHSTISRDDKYPSWTWFTTSCPWSSYSFHGMYSVWDCQRVSAFPSLPPSCQKSVVPLAQSLPSLPPSLAPYLKSIGAFSVHGRYTQLQEQSCCKVGHLRTWWGHCDGETTCTFWTSLVCFHWVRKCLTGEWKHHHHVA